jgi:hypothetical protein
MAHTSGEMPVGLAMVVSAVSALSGVAVVNHFHILEERFGTFVSHGRVGAFPIPNSELITRKNRLVGLAPW